MSEKPPIIRHVMILFPSAKKYIAQLEEENERLMKGISQINWRAKTESLDGHLRNVVIEISDALKESE